MPQDSNVLPFPEPLDSKLQSVVDTYYQGNGVGALKQCISLIDEGYSGAYVFAGAFYEKGGNGIEPDYAKARFYYEKSLEERGSIEAYLGLARIHFYGLGVEVDYCKALPLYEKVARESDDPVANLMLGKMHQNGLCVNSSSQTAREYYQRAWSSGHILGLTYLGLLEQKDGNYLKGLWLRLKAGYLGFRAAVKDSNDPRLRNS